MIQYEEALNYITAAAQSLPIIKLKIIDALGYISAESLSSKEQVPSFHNSAMDGFALRASETSQASAETPLIFPIMASITAGEGPSSIAFPLHSCCEIMTGAIVPDCFDAVVKIEDVKIHENKIFLFNPIKPSNNIRYAGEDFDIGSILIHAGDYITPEHIMAFAAVGVTDINVRRKPIVRVITTGSELVQLSNDPLRCGKIRNSNAAYLEAVFKSMSIVNYKFFTVADDINSFIRCLNEEINVKDSPDIVITTGGVSAGKCDFVPEALKQLGAEIRFHKVNIRPGKPILFAQLGKINIFSLPGNPISMAVGFRFFIYPLLRQIQGQKTEQPLMAMLTEDMQKNTSMQHFWKAHLHFTEEGQACVESLPGQESFKISPLLKANAWLILEANQKTLLRGQIMRVYPLHVWDLS